MQENWIQLQALTQTFFLTLGYPPDVAGSELPSYKMEIWILKAPYSLFGCPRLWCRDIDQERDFLDHEGREGWGGRIHSKINVTWSKKQAKHRFGKPGGRRRGFIHTDGMAVSWWDKDRCWAVRSISAVGRKDLPGRKAQVLPGKAIADSVALRWHAGKAGKAQRAGREGGSF